MKDLISSVLERSERFLQVGNLKIFTRIAGEGSPFLILHGWGRGHISWIEVQDKLSKYFQVITLDLPGFGKSAMPPKGWEVSDYARFVSEFVKELNIDKFYLLGHSFGGSIAIKLSAQSPQKIRKLILVDSAGIRPKTSFFKKILAPVISIFKIFFFLPGYGLLRKGFYKFILKSTDYLNAKGVMKETFKKVVAEDLSSRFSEINLSTLIVWGKKDKMTSIKDAYLMKQRIKDSELKIFDCEHCPHKEKPDFLIKAILDFLNKNGN